MAEHIINRMISYIKAFLDYRFNSLLLLLHCNEAYLKRLYMSRTGYKLDIKNPQSFNEKIQWLKLNDIHEEYTNMVDKVAVKEYVKCTVGIEYVIPTIGVWDSIENIDWASLPEQFVLKVNNDSSGVIICKDKSLLNIPQCIEILKKKGNRDYSKVALEYPYHGVPHKFFAETYLVDESGTELKDYKVFCFNGEPRFIQVDSCRFTSHKRAFYDTEWKKMPVQLKYPQLQTVLPKPQSLEKMLNIARKLSQGKPFVRVDLYDSFGKVYFGEMTFFPGSGFEAFSPQEWNNVFGKLLKLPVKSVHKSVLCKSFECVKNKIQAIKLGYLLKKLMKTCGNDVCIISSNCLAGHVYHDLKMQYMSPTAGLFFFADDYAEFVENFEIYIKRKILIKNSSKWEIANQKRKISGDFYPIGRFEGTNVEIHFLHYKSSEEALSKWYRRVQRINMNNLVFLATWQNLPSDVFAKKLLSIENKKVFLFSPKKFPYKGNVYLKEFKNLERMPDPWNAPCDYLSGLINGYNNEN